MHITFDHQNKQNMVENASIGMTQGSVNTMRGSSSVNASKMQEANGVLFVPSKNDNSVYGEKGKSFHDVMDEMGSKDTALYKNYMAVMAGTMSGEDFSRLTKDGVAPGKVDVKDAVTIMDHIKAVMAESGVVISGFNGASDLSIEKLTQMTGDAGYANAIKNTFAQQDLPLTEDTVKDTIQSVDQATNIKEITDDMKQYLLENDLAPTIDHLYLAGYSTTGNGQNTSSGYFADSMNGYYGKKPQEIDFEALANQVEKIAMEEGLAFDDTVKTEAKWMLEKGIFLTGKNLLQLHQMNQMQLPMSRDKVIEDVAQSLRAGQKPGETDLSTEGIFTKAENLYEEIQNVSDDAIQVVVANGQTLSIRSLSMAQRQIQPDQLPIVSEENLLHARRTLEEVRLKMTVSANISLLKSNYAIDTAPLEDLVEKLKQTEEKSSHYGLSLPLEKQSLYEETMTKTAEIRQMPIQLVGQISIKDHFTLQEVHAQGQILKSTYDKAGQSYEALMTAPRADLGDRLKDAFQNVDDILVDEGFEATEDNRRAVRILAYNQMDITEESINSIRQADEQLRSLLNLMTPSATLAMIRDGINPLNQSIPELYQYMKDQDETLTNQTERFSRFLYKLDQRGDISKEERESFIGIYRLIRQIEKGDGKAIGTVVANGQQMSFANLLTAVRTNQTGYVEASVDDQSELTTISTPKNSISDQINSYYQMQATKMLDSLNVDALKQVDEDMTWEKLSETIQNSQVNEEEESQLLNEQLKNFRESLAGQQESIEFLVVNDVTVSADNVQAAKEHLDHPDQLYKKVKNSLIQGDADFDASMQELADGFTSTEDAQSAFEVFADSISQRLEEQMMKEDATYLDIRQLSLTAKQISLASSMAKQESYELPAYVFGELTSVNIQFVRQRGEALEPNAAIQIQLSDGRQVMADIRLRDEKINCFIGCNDHQIEDALKQKSKEFGDQLLLKTEKTADISVIYSETLMHNAGKQMPRTNQEGKEQGRQESSRQLYMAVQEFMGMVQKLQ